MSRTCETKIAKENDDCYLQKPFLVRTLCGEDRQTDRQMRKTETDKEEGEEKKTVR